MKSRGMKMLDYMSEIEQFLMVAVIDQEFQVLDCLEGQDHIVHYKRRRLK